MVRLVLTDAQWAKMEPHCLGKPTDPGRSGSNNRRFVEAVLWIVRTGSPWRDLPAPFGKWNTVFKRYRDWAKADVFKRLFDACSDEPDMEYAMVDHRYDTVGVPPLIEDLAFGGLIADMAFDSNTIIADLNERRAKVVIAQHPRRSSPLLIDADLYKWRHLIENFFGKLKEFKRIAMRADKTDKSFKAAIYLAAAVINSR
ncbi:MAG: family transposase [Nitrobacter vulgaris]|nr:family transposase [Nitrobacter vulgaris]